MRIDWTGFATTKNDEARDVSHEPGFSIGWDSWSDGWYYFSPGLFTA